MSNNLGRTNVVVGDDNKEVKIAASDDAIDAALTSSLSIAWAGVEVLKSVSISQCQSNLAFVCTGTTAGADPTLKFPAVQRGLVLVTNSTDVLITVRDYTSATAVLVSPSTTVAIYVTASAVVKIFDNISVVLPDTSVDPCRVATTADITIATDLNAGDTIDGVVLAGGDRVLVWKQATQSDNGIYICGPSPARATDFDGAGEVVAGTMIAVTEGTAHSDKLFMLTTNNPITVGSTALVFKVLTQNAVAYASAAQLYAMAATARAISPAVLSNIHKVGSDVASAATLVLGDGRFFNITGTTGITDIDFATSSKDGREAILKFTDALTLTHSGTLQLPGGANILTAAGDRGSFVQINGDEVHCVWYTRADGTPLVNASFSPASVAETLTGVETGKAVTPASLLGLWGKGSDTASAGTVSLGDGGLFHITGTTAITDIDFADPTDGRMVSVVFDGILNLVHNGTTMKLPGGANITTAAGDRACFVQDASDNVICLWYTKADGTPLVGTGGYSDENAQDAVAAMLAAGTHTGINFTYNDGTNSMDATVTSGGREKLLANRTYYVRTDGSDTNTGLANTSGAAFLTISRAIQEVVGAVDWNGYAATIAVADGTYNENLTFNQVPVGLAGPITLTGNDGTPANAVISTASNAVVVDNGAALSINGFTLAGTYGVGMLCQGGSLLRYGNIRLTGSAISVGVQASQNSNVVQLSGKSLEFAPGGNIANGFRALTSAQITIQASGAFDEIVFTGTPNFTTAFITTQQGGVFQANSNFSFTGVSTGPAFYSDENGLIAATDIAASGFPGSSLGTIAGGRLVWGTATQMIFDSTLILITANTTIGISNVGRHTVTNSASDLTVTIPPNSTTALPVGSRIIVDRWGTGAATLAPGAGVTFLPGGSQNISRQGGSITAIKVDTDTWLLSGDNPVESLMIAASDESTALTTGTGKVTFRMPYAFTVTEIRASLVVAQASGSVLTVDVNESGSSIISTKLTFDNTEKTTVTAATPPVISDSSLANDAEITIDIDQVGDGTAKGLKVTLIGRRT